MVTERHLGEISSNINNLTKCGKSLKKNFFPAHGTNGYKVHPLLYWPKSHNGMKRVVADNCDYWGLKSEPAGFGTESCYFIF